MSSPSIDTSLIPNTRVPGFYGQINTNNALPGLTPLTDTICLMAQRLSTGTVAAKIPTKVFSDGDAALYFGTGSIAHLATRAAIQANPYINLTVVGIDDAGGATDATGSVSIDTTATIAGQLDLWVGDQHVSTGVGVGDGTATIATALKTALDQISNYLPVTYTLSTATLTFTARNGGTLGNFTTISSKNTSNATLTVTDMAGGATDPDVGAYDTTATVLASVVGGSYTIFNSTLPDSANLGKIKTMIDFASNSVEQRGCVATFGYTDQVGTLATAESLCGTTLNSGRMSCAYISFASDNLAKTEPWKVGAGYSAMLAATPDPVVPYDGLVVKSVAQPSVVDRFTYTVKQNLLENGVAPLAVIPGEETAIVRAISTYTKNSASVADPTLLDINTMRTLDYVRLQTKTRITSRFQRQKLNARTLKLIKSEVLDVLYVLERAEIVQNVATYEDGVIVEQDTSDVTRVNIKIPTNIVSGLHVIGASFDLILGV